MTDKILVTSNDQEVAKRLAMMLAAEGYSACILDSLKDFETEVNPLERSLLIVDCQQTCLEDSEPIEMIKSITKNTTHKCLILVPSGPENMFNGLIPDESVTYLQKPIVHASFVRTVEDILGEPLSDSSLLSQVKNDVES